MEAEDDGGMGEKMTDEERKKLCAELRQPLLNAKWVCRKAADEIERLADERDQFAEQLVIRSETGMAKDMQEIMRINNELSEQLALAQSNAEQETPSDHSLELAAQAWCEPETSHKVMDEVLCTAFARILDRALAQSDAEPVAHPDTPTHRDMAYFGASEAAGYHYPGEDQQLLRDAYCRGAAEYAPRPDASAGQIEVAEVMKTAELYAGRLHACLLGAGFEPPRQKWLAAHFRDAITSHVKGRVRAEGNAK